MLNLLISGHMRGPLWLGIPQTMRGLNALARKPDPIDVVGIVAAETWGEPSPVAAEPGLIPMKHETNKIQFSHAGNSLPNLTSFVHLHVPCTSPCRQRRLMRLSAGTLTKELQAGVSVQF